MGELAAGYYDATITDTCWTRSRTGNMGLSIQLDIQGDSYSGAIWFSEKTTAPSKHTDGTPGRSMAERALAAVGYTGTFERAADIGNEVSLVGNKTRVQLKYDDYVGGIKVNGFVERQMSKDAVSAALAKAMGKPAPVPAEPEGDDDVPSAPENLPANAPGKAQAASEDAPIGHLSVADLNALSFKELQKVCIALETAMGAHAYLSAANAVFGTNRDGAVRTPAIVTEAEQSKLVEFYSLATTPNEVPF